MSTCMEKLQTINLVSIMVRLVLALLCGGVLGLDREKNRRPAGLRTYTLVCVGAAMVMMTSQFVLEGKGTGDVFRMGAQVISGIGFLGAGTIIVTGHRQVRGLTTAAGLWVAACIGLAVGIGFYSGAIISTLVMLLVLTWFHYFEDKISHKSSSMNLFIELDSISALGGVLRVARENHVTISDVDISKGRNIDDSTVVMLTASFSGAQNRDGVLHLLGTAPGIRHIEEY
ncbi:MAG: MgtC/SapB family protein [Oscillospiraceae bacterium]|nr:MgtC/SapB family protein [Oscillospiraceae bacterium]